MAVPAAAVGGEVGHGAAVATTSSCCTSNTHHAIQADQTRDSNYEPSRGAAAGKMGEAMVLKHGKSDKDASHKNSW